MKRFYVETRYILLFFLVLTAATVFSNLDMEGAKPSPLAVVADPAPGPRRDPASVQDKDSLVMAKEFFCNSPPAERNKVPKHIVSIQFKMCDRLKDVQKILMENQSNGFKAQIFKLEQNNFKTDYIQLSEGVNKLKFEVVLKDGQKKSESLEILSGS